MDLLAIKACRFSDRRDPWIGSYSFRYPMDSRYTQTSTRCERARSPVLILETPYCLAVLRTDQSQISGFVDAHVADIEPGF